MNYFINENIHFKYICTDENFILKTTIHIYFNIALNAHILILFYFKF
jgi:hypothetical protein